MKSTNINIMKYFRRIIPHIAQIKDQPCFSLLTNTSEHFDSKYFEH